MGRNELLEESEYSGVGAGLAAGSYEDQCGASCPRKYSWTRPIGKYPLASRDVRHRVRLEGYRSITAISERQANAGGRNER
jgi:hypothetical protein